MDRSTTVVLYTQSHEPAEDPNPACQNRFAIYNLLRRRNMHSLLWIRVTRKTGGEGWIRSSVYYCNIFTVCTLYALPGMS